jgi:putative transposase
MAACAENDYIYTSTDGGATCKARSLLCFWAARELGISLTELARRLGISVPGVGYSVVRGERIAHESDYQLVE